jgi:hypothetical protein
MRVEERGLRQDIINGVIREQLYGMSFHVCSGGIDEEQRGLECGTEDVGV